MAKQIRTAVILECPTQGCKTILQIALPPGVTPNADDPKFKSEMAGKMKKDKWGVVSISAADGTKDAFNVCEKCVKKFSRRFYEPTEAELAEKAAKKAERAAKKLAKVGKK